MDNTLMSLAIESENLLDAALRVTDVGTWHWDIANNTITFSEEISRIFHLEFEGNSITIEYLIQEIMHPDYTEIFEVSIKEAFMTGFASKTEYKILGTDKSEYWIRFDGQFTKNDAGHVVSGRGTILDLTPLKRITHLINKNFNFLETLIQIIPSPMFYKDAKGYYRYCNQAFAEYIGLPIEKIINHSVYDVAPDELAAVYYEADNELLIKQGVQIYEAEVQYVSGDYRDVVFNKTVLLDDNGESIGIVGLMIDITEQNNTHRLIEKQNLVKDILISVSHTINDYSNENDLYRDLLSRLLPIFRDCDNASVLKISENNRLEIQSCTSDYLEDTQYFSISKEDSYLFKATKGAFSNSDIIRNVQAYAAFGEPIVDPTTGLMINETLYIPIFNQSKIEVLITFNTSKKDLFRPLDCVIGNYMSEQIPIILQVLKLNQSILNLSRYDNLTALMNRHYFNITLNNLLSKARETSTQLVLVSFDLDDLKGINDSLGHQAGDHYLIAFSEFLKKSFKTQDAFARIGGDEFIGLFPVETTEKILIKLGNVQSAFQEEVITSNKVTFKGRFSYGLAIYPTDGNSIDELMTIADRRMYEDKNDYKKNAPK